MTLGVALLVGAAVSGHIAPYLLSAVRRVLNPSGVVLCWYLAVAGLCAAVVTGLVLVAVPSVVAGHPAGGLAGPTWWTVVAGAPDLLPYRLMAVAVPVLLAVLAARLVFVARRRRRAVRAAIDGLARLRVVADTDRCPSGGPPTLWLRTDRPVAFSIGGRDGAVVLTAGLRDRLSGPAMDAVLAHERAHVRGRHHAVVAVADLVAAAFPAVRLFAEAPAALREQVELAADLAAVRRCGPDAVRDALDALADAEGASTADRVAALTRPASPASRLRRVVGAGAAGGLLVLAPFLAAALVLVALAGLAATALALA